MLETQEMQLPSLSQEYPLEEEMVTHSSILAGKLPWTKEPGRLQSIRSQRVGYYSAHTHKSLSDEGILIRKHGTLK